MNFPHLKDTTFPNLETVDVYQFQNNFDYTRWNEDTKIKLVNVIWNSDYSDVVKFDTNKARDSYFDSIDDYYAIELLQAARIVPQNYVKLPIPYDVMARYNYLFIDMPIATSADTPLDYETNNGKRRWYFFIDSVAYLSPNSTQVFLSLDVWTNFQNDVEINYMMLERGHAPVAATNTNEYLQNPIANNRYLLAPDVNFDNAGITRSNKYVPFGNERKYVCVASTCTPEQLQALGEVTQDSSYDPTGNITYSDTGVRYGHQLEVNGLTVGNGRDYSAAKTPASAAFSGDGIIGNNLTVYAILASYVYGNDFDNNFFDDIMTYCPQFLNTIQACFIVDENCITLGTEHRLVGWSIYECVGAKRNLYTERLKQDDFNYPTELRRFAKLYTSPYAVLEVTDNDGTTFTINIEETSTVKVKSVVSVAFPYIDYRVYLDGIGGVGSTQYAWADLRGHVYGQEISNSDWFKYCFDWNIPTFALFMDGETAFQLANFNRAVDMGINNALVSYHNAMRGANTAYENAKDAANTTLTNVQNSTDTARTNAYNSADTGKTNADNSADTAKTNTDASADTMYTNVDNTCNTLRANTDLEIANNVSNEEDGIAASTAQTNISENLATATVSNSNLAIVTTTQTQNETTAATTAMNGIQQQGSAVSSGATGGAGIGAAIGGAIGSAIPGAGTAIGALIGAAGGMALGSITGFVAACFSNANAAIITQGNTVTSDATIQANVDNVNDTNLAATNTLQSNNILRRAIYTNNNNLADSEMTNNNANDRTNANNSRNTEKANATRAQNTAKTNATNTQNTSKTNANNNFNTDRTNATNTRNLIHANSGHTRQVEELNAKELLENAAATAMAAVKDAANAKPIQIGESGGNPAADFMQTRGIQIKVKTQSDSAIRQTGDTFARYGYALNQMWNVAESGLNLMRHFTYWKASDIWVDDRESSNNSIQDFITKIFLRGVTVWKVPTEIGRVSIYDN